MIPRGTPARPGAPKWGAKKGGRAVEGGRGGEGEDDSGEGEESVTVGGSGQSGPTSRVLSGSSATSTFDS